MKNNKCFFAYSSKTPSHVEIIEEAIKELNNSKIAEVIGWRKISTTGKCIIIEICKEINNCSLFLCDLTTPLDIFRI